MNTEFTEEQIDAVYREVDAGIASDPSGHTYPTARLILQARTERDAALARVRELEEELRHSRAPEGPVTARPAVTNRHLDDARERIAALEAENVEVREEFTSFIHAAAENMRKVEAENVQANAFIEKLTTLNEKTERENADLKHRLQSPWWPICGRDLDPNEFQRIAENERWRVAFEGYAADVATQEETQSLDLRRWREGWEDCLAELRAAMEGKPSQADLDAAAKQGTSLRRELEDRLRAMEGKSDE